MESDTEMNTFQCYPLYPLFENDLFSVISTNGFEDDLFSGIPPNGFKNIVGNLDILNTETRQYNSGVNTSVDDSITETQLPESENNNVVDIQEEEESDEDSTN
ncbi:11837_t:CDS:2 [Gigaspora rosea]|nr:11837_t:CDS:2 [Gigaspora rosea]